MGERGKVLTGGRVHLALEGVKMMYCTNVTYGEEVEQAPIEVLDQFEVAEFVPVAYRCTFSAQLVRMINQPIKLRNGVKIFPGLDNILTLPEMTGTVVDRVTNTIAANIERVKCSRYSNAYPARGIVIQDAEFVAIVIRDESELKK